jgi:hypothetical protein
VSNGKTKKGWKPFPPKNKLIKDSEGNEEKWIPSSRLQQNKDKLCQGTQQSHKNALKEEILQVITENFMEILLT